MSEALKAELAVALHREQEARIQNNALRAENEALRLKLAALPASQDDSAKPEILVKTMHFDRTNRHYWETRPTSQSQDDSAELLDWLEKFLKACPHGIVAFNDDPDIDCEDSEDGLMPVGYRIAVSGCQGPMIQVADNLRSAIRAAREKEKP